MTTEGLCKVHVSVLTSTQLTFKIKTSPTTPEHARDLPNLSPTELFHLDTCTLIWDTLPLACFFFLLSIPPIVSHCYQSPNQ